MACATQPRRLGPLPPFSISFFSWPHQEALITWMALTRAPAGPQVERLLGDKARLEAEAAAGRKEASSAQVGCVHGGMHAWHRKAEASTCMHMGRTSHAITQPCIL